MTIDQLSITLAKLYNGTVPGDDTWCELDYDALEFSLGYPVYRKPTQLEFVFADNDLIDG